MKDTQEGAGKTAPFLPGFNRNQTNFEPVFEERTTEFCYSKISAAGHGQNLSV